MFKLKTSHSSRSGVTRFPSGILLKHHTQSRGAETPNPERVEENEAYGLGRGRLWPAGFLNDLDPARAPR